MNLSVVGSCFTASVVQFQAMRTTLANLWPPRGGVTITDLGDDPMALLLFWADFWVQIHDLPMGLMSETMARQFRNFQAQFLEYDVKSLNKGYRGYMRIHVRIDVRNPLMRRKKLISGSKGCTYVRFQYEKLSIFFFLYGRLGHLERFCVTPLTRICR
ncbi:hypothetical protein Goari_010755 [Gossypium aridum]|uniref:Zinc knuckle CX2CX4HX4C domain-containing protein n=1 Tax=Gossypium aridum TaxID=34290 RepID=A0A7J8Y114_GOSAI|nr:hypothetical protein [Gossypium aridum]